MPHTGLWVDENQVFSVRNDLCGETYTTEAHDDTDVLLEPLWLAVNPADKKHTTALGIVNEVIGSEFSGVVIQAGSRSTIKAGEHVTGFASFGCDRPDKYGAHQQLLVANVHIIHRVPSGVAMNYAASLPLAVATAVDALFNRLNLPDPSQNPNSFDEPVVIWGGSSAVGFAATQLAKASGATNIIVTTSSLRFEMLKKAGATHMVDYHQADCVSQVKQIIESIGFVPKGVFDAVSIPFGSSTTSAQAIQATGVPLSKFTSTVPLSPDLALNSTIASVLSNEPTFIIRGGRKIQIPAKPAEDQKRAKRIWHWSMDGFLNSEDPRGFHGLELQSIQGQNFEKLLEVVKNINEVVGNGSKIVFQVPRVNPV